MVRPECIPSAQYLNSIQCPFNLFNMMLIGVVVSQQWNDRSGADNDLERYMQYLCSSTRVQRQVALSVRKCRHRSDESGEIGDRGTSKYSGNYPSRSRVFRENTLWSAEVEASWHLLYCIFIYIVLYFI